MKHTTYRGKDWGKLAESFEKLAEKVVGSEINESIFLRLKRETGLGAVVEFGCGTGYFSQAVVNNVKNLLLTDISSDMLNIAKQKFQNFKNISFEISNCSQTQFADNMFDTVLITNVLHVIKSPRTAFEEIHRILKPGGSMIAADLTGFDMSFPAKIKLIFRYLVNMGIPPKADKGNLTLEDFKTFAAETGFRIENNELIRTQKINAVYFKGRKFLKN